MHPKPTSITLLQYDAEMGWRGIEMPPEPATIAPLLQHNAEEEWRSI